MSNHCQITADLLFVAITIIQVKAKGQTTICDKHKIAKVVQIPPLVLENMQLLMETTYVEVRYT